MPKWLVRLKGETFDLEDLPALLRSPELTITEENGSYYLESSEFEVLTSAYEVKKRGIALIEMIDGAVKLYRGNFGNISEDGVIRIEDNGRRHQYVFPRAALMILRGAKAIVTTSNGAQATASRRSVVETALSLAKKYGPVADALHLFRDGSYRSLYNALEIIADDVGGQSAIVKNGWVSAAKLSRFTHTAQSRAALGDHARHASKKYKPPARPMSPADARSLIKGLIMNWLDTKS